MYLLDILYLICYLVVFLVSFIITLLSQKGKRISVECVCVLLLLCLLYVCIWVNGAHNTRNSTEARLIM